jgi:inhibitor of KinA
MRIYPLNECAITVELGDIISEEVHLRVMAIREEIIKRSYSGILDVVTAYTTVTVFFDANVVRSLHTVSTPLKTIETFLRKVCEEIKEGVVDQKLKMVTVPVCYEVEYAPDLDWVASHHQTTNEEIIRRHTKEIFTVFMIGFTPGFPYMGILPPELESPRRQNPRIQVPAGSVGLAGKQTGIYPYATPGGWQIIGRTPLKLFDTTSLNPSLLKPGDRVKFESISKKQFLNMIDRA